MKKFLFFALLSTIILTGCTKPSEEVDNSNESDTSIFISNKPRPMEKPELTIDQSKTYTAKFVTNYGEFTVELDAANKPITTNNFVYLARNNFYDGVIFHRIIDGFMIQGGDPEGLGTGGPGYKFEDELDAPNSNIKGSISMANAGPNTNGSQFFINLVNNNFLDDKHTAFGNVIEGMEVVEEIGVVEVMGSSPVEPVVIMSIEIIEN
jgi:peptidylprolyl isomerase